jgi:hypothetical protein
VKTRRGLVSYLIYFCIKGLAKVLSTLHSHLEMQKVKTAPEKSKPKLKIVFWVSKQYFKPGIFEQSLCYIKQLSSFAREIVVKIAPLDLKTLFDEIAFCLRDKVYQAHVILTGDNEIEKDIHEGNKNYTTFAYELLSMFIYSENILLFCNLIPHAEYSSLSMYKKVYEETAIGLKVILTYELFSENIYFFDPCLLLLDSKGAITEFYNVENNCLNEKGALLIAKSVLKIISHIRANQDKNLTPTPIFSEEIFLNGEKLIWNHGIRFFIWE